MSVSDLSCIKAITDGISYVCLLDSGANVSAIEIGLIRALGLESLVKREKLRARGWNGSETDFIGRFVLDIEIGGVKFTQTMCVATKLATGTQVILGMNFLKKAKADLRFRDDGVRLSINDGQMYIPLTKPKKKVRMANTLTVYETGYAETINPIAWAMEHKRINPYTGSVVKCTVSGEKIPEHITLEYRQIQPGLLVDPQVVTPLRNKPNPKAKCKRECAIKCSRSCPTKEFLYCWVYVYKATDKILLVAPEKKIAEGEAIYVDPELTNSVNSAINKHRPKETNTESGKQVRGGATGKKTPNKELETKGATSKSKRKRVTFSKGQKNLVENKENIAEKEATLPKGEIIPDGDENFINFLKLDPVLDKDEYSKQYHQKHRPKIPIAKRRKLVEELINKECPDINIMAKNLILKYPETIHIPGIPYVGTKSVCHRIVYSGPVFFNRQYRVPQILEADIQAEIDRLLSEDLIECSESPYSNAFLPVTKIDPKSGKLKICVCLDLRSLNKGVQIDRLCIQNIQDLLNKLSGCKYLTVLDAASGYLQIPMTYESKPFTAFRYNNTCYVHNTMPFGLGSAPSTYIRFMNIVTSNIPGCFVYMDDLLIFSKTWKEHKNTMEQLLKRFSFYGLELNVKKCQFVTKEVEYLGFTFTPEGIKPQERLVKPMLEARMPKTLTEARSLISLFSFYRRFIRNFSMVAAPLINLTKGYTGKGKRVQVKADKDCEESLATLKKALIDDVCLKYPNFDKKFVLITDASTKGLGAMLGQYDKENNLRPIAFASKSLNKAQQRYAAIDLECSGIVFGLKAFRPLIYGREIEIHTDHKPLIYLFKHADPNSRLYNYQLQILDYNITGISHISGKSNSTSDYLSR